MNDKPNSLPKPISPHALSPGEMRSSFILPIVLAVGLALVATAVVLITPESFNRTLAILITVALLAFLVYWTRKITSSKRLTAVALAIPALIGLGYGVSNGRLGPILLGIGITGILLLLYRAISTPISYRVAYNLYKKGQYSQALQLSNKTIAARPDFWEAYQLKAIIHLQQGAYAQAEQAAQTGTAVAPYSDLIANTLGQIYLAQGKFAEAKDAYATAVTRNSDHALHWYYLGISQYYAGEYAAAADAFSASSKRSPRILEYELLCHYYLWQSLNKLGKTSLADEVQQKMQKFSQGVPLLQAQISQTDLETNYLTLLRQEMPHILAQFPAEGQSS